MDSMGQLISGLLLSDTETTNNRLFAAKGNGKRKFVFLGQQMISGSRRLLFCKRAHLSSLQMSLLGGGGVIKIDSEVFKSLGLPSWEFILS